jgi:platelet-activating factor acetylhydrolase IB subunit alpha
MIAYLSSIGQSDSAAALQEVLGVDSNFDEPTRKRYEGLLEKKWTSVVRMQKKVVNIDSMLDNILTLM